MYIADRVKITLWLLSTACSAWEWALQYTDPSHVSVVAFEWSEIIGGSCNNP